MKLVYMLLVLGLMAVRLSAETLIINDPNDGWLNLRSGPGTSFRVIQRMENGLRVEELERQGSWSNVALPGGATGWTYRKYTKPAPAAVSVAPKPSAKTLIVNDPNDGWLNLRSGPGTSFRVIQRMENGLRVEELERQGSWTNVALPGDVTGWAYRKYMKDVAQPKTAPVAPVAQAQAQNASESPDVTASGSGVSYFEEDTKDEDVFCSADERPDFPAYYDAEYAINGRAPWRHPTARATPVSLNYVGIGTTVWDGIPSSGHKLVLYSNGAAKLIRVGVKGGAEVVEEVMQGSWQRPDNRGLKTRLRSVRKDSDKSYDHIECEHGAIAAFTHSAYRGSEKAHWRSCHLVFKCQRWADKFSDKMSFGSSGSLREWSRGHILPSQMRWFEYRVNKNKNR
jgi:uncharacterized protein YgiM (DUF1202 family)